MEEVVETSLPLCTSDVTQEVAIRQKQGENGGFAKIPPLTVMQNFDAVVAKYGGKPALNQKIVRVVSCFACFCLLYLPFFLTVFLQPNQRAFFGLFLIISNTEWRLEIVDLVGISCRS
jgi:hypothetical protein